MGNNAEHVCPPEVTKPSWCNQTQPFCIIITVTLSVLLNHMSVRNAKHHGHHKSRLIDHSFRAVGTHKSNHFCMQKCRSAFGLPLNNAIAKTPEHGWMTKRVTERPSLAFTVIQKINSQVSVFYMHRCDEMCET